MLLAIILQRKLLCGKMAKVMSGDRVGDFGTHPPALDSVDARKRSGAGMG